MGNKSTNYASACLFNFCGARKQCVT